MRFVVYGERDAYTVLITFESLRLARGSFEKSGLGCSRLCCLAQLLHPLGVDNVLVDCDVPFLHQNFVLDPQVLVLFKQLCVLSVDNHRHQPHVLYLGHNVL